MDNDSRKIVRAIEIFKAIAEGNDPFTNEPFKEESFANDPRMVRCLYYVIEVLGQVASGEIGKSGGRNSSLPFVITEEEKRNVNLPAEKIGVNAFVKCINEVTNPLKSKNLTGVILNAQLKKMGILGEEDLEGGKHRTILNDSSAGYGIEMVHADYNGNKYDKVVFNDTGKKFLLEHLEEILNYR